jgi:hypothetical protein
VNLSVHVLPDGSVNEVTGGEDPPAYAGLTTCIVELVRAWKFAPSSTSTTINIPFVFGAK